MTGCCGDGIPACEGMFDRRTAEGDLRRLRRDGPPWATRALIDELATGLDLEGATILDIGAGVGAVHLALLERGAGSAVDVDGSSAYLELAREEAARRGLVDRVRYRLGDVTGIEGELDGADVVVLDRVLCCYPDLDRLLAAAARLTRDRLGLVYPHDWWWVRAATAIANPLAFRGAAGYRMRIHRVASVAAVLRDAGLARRSIRRGRLWRVEVWSR